MYTHETSTLTFSVQIYHQVLEDVHVCSVGDTPGGWRAALAVDVGNGIGVADSVKKVEIQDRSRQKVWKGQ